MKTNFRMALWLLRSGIALLPHNDLWIIGFIELKRFARVRWWARVPFLPLPSSEFWEFRMESIYGDPKAMPSRRDLVEFLQWCMEIR
ncbi:MAG: hypothetical protein EPN30_01010 [Actinomycetota bacterium]|nr:MAG: hypothetical protein EPN30_01010 [Actinomycetota bacterium]